MTSLSRFIIPATERCEGKLFIHLPATEKQWTVIYSLRGPSEKGILSNPLEPPPPPPPPPPCLHPWELHHYTAAKKY